VNLEQAIAAFPPPAGLTGLPLAVARRLDECGIACAWFVHPPVVSIDQARAVRREPTEVGHCKNLYATPVRRGEERNFLLSIPEHKRADFHGVARQIGTTKLQLIGAEGLLEVLGVMPGAVSPLCLVRPEAAAVTLLLDLDLREQQAVCFHPGINTASVSFSQADFGRFLDRLPNPIVWVENL